MVWNAEEERLRRQWADAIRSGRASPAPPGMISQTAVTPEMMERAAANPKAQELGIQLQQEYANQLRGAKLPEGRTTGDIFVESNPLETLGAVANQGIGAIAARKIREEALPALDTAYADQGMAQQQIDEARNQQGIEQKVLDRNIDQARLNETMRSNQAGEGIQRGQLAQSWAGTKPLEAVDTSGEDRPPLFARYNEAGRLIDTQTNQPVPSGYQLRDDPNLFGGAGKGGATPKNPRRWADVDGNERYTIDVGTDIIDQFTGEPINQDLAAGNFYEESSVSGSSRNSAVQKLAKDTANLRSVATDYNDMVGTFDKYGIDLFNGDDPLGRFQKADGAVGTLTRMMQDAVEPGAETGELYSSVRAVLNSVIRNQAGMSQTVAEIEKINKQYGLGWQDDPAIMAEALARLAPKIKEDIGANVAAVDKNTLAAYRNRLADFDVPDWTKWGQESPGRLPGEGDTTTSKLPKSRGTRRGRGIGGNKDKPTADTTALDEQIRRLEEELGIQP